MHVLTYPIGSIRRPGRAYLDEDPVYVVVAHYHQMAEEVEYVVWPIKTNTTTPPHPTDPTNPTIPNQSISPNKCSRRHPQRVVRVGWV